MKQSQLLELFIDELKDIYWAEKALTKAIPTMIENASSFELIEALTSHLEDTHKHVERVREVFELIGKKPEAKPCKAMQGLIEEAGDIMKSCEEGPMRDAGIISAAQKVEHYEMATYGTLRQFSETLKLTRVVALLAATLQEEKAADEKLSSVAIGAVNVEAALESM
ncbi:YciE/YciF ferroxidase family protein [Flavobacterium terrisoli]|uniref:YciE/YciF ferroxidase family protein n=1 Tax=Flavobacterium terrisoli TaxID=3242195 RepID=UPI002543370C|nr:ferritin-like domain-containing protein [Flavobacterium buctense]